MKKWIENDLCLPLPGVHPPDRAHTPKACEFPLDPMRSPPIALSRHHTSWTFLPKGRYGHGREIAGGDPVGCRRSAGPFGRHRSGRRSRTTETLILSGSPQPSGSGARARPSGQPSPDRCLAPYRAIDHQCKESRELQRADHQELDLRYPEQDSRQDRDRRPPRGADLSIRFRRHKIGSGFSPRSSGVTTKFTKRVVTGRSTESDATRGGLLERNPVAYGFFVTTRIYES